MVCPIPTCPDHIRPMSSSTLVKHVQLHINSNSWSPELQPLLSHLKLSKCTTCHQLFHLTLSTCPYCKCNCGHTQCPPPPLPSHPLTTHPLVGDMPLFNPPLMEVLQHPVTTIHHIPVDCRPLFLSVYIQLLDNFSTSLTWESFYAVMTVPKLVLWPPLPRPKSSKPLSLADQIKHRIHLFQQQKYSQLWFDLLQVFGAQSKNARSRKRPRPVDDSHPSSPSSPSSTMLV